MRRSLLLACVSLCAALGAAPVADAGFFAADPIDGPSADIQALGGVAVARDGTGGLVYLRKDGGADHVFVSRLEGGRWTPPERIDGNVGDEASQPVIAAGDGGRLAVAFISGGNLWTSVRPAGAPSFPAPIVAGSSATNPSVSISVNGIGWLSYTSGTDVRAARLERNGSAFFTLDQPLDFDPAQNAGDGPLKRSRVSVSADGVGIVVWGETGADGRTHVFARKVFGTSVSTAPQDLTLDSFDGRSGGSADSPEVSIENDSSFAWATFRQAFDDGGRSRTRVLARRLVGSLFDSPMSIDNLSFPAAEGGDAPEVHINGAGQGIVAAMTQTTNQALMGVIQDDVLQPVQRLDSIANSVPPRPQTAIGENGEGLAAWAQSAGITDPASIHARALDDGQPQENLSEAVLSRDDLGAVDTAAGFDAAADRGGDVAVAFMQGAADSRLLVAGSLDKPPGTFQLLTTQKFRKFKRPPLVWQAAFDLWGPVTYTVTIDNAVVGTTTDTKLTPANVVPDGIHHWNVTATDIRGQAALPPVSRLLRVDATPPRLTVAISGTRALRHTIEFRVHAGDVLTPSASGFRFVRLDYGDGSLPTTLFHTKHRYIKRGRYTVKVSAYDKAGNVTVLRRVVRIKGKSGKKKK